MKRLVYFRRFAVHSLCCALLMCAAARSLTAAETVPQKPSAEMNWKPLLIPKALVVVGSWGDMFRWREAMHVQGILFDDAFTIVNRSLVGMPTTEEEYYGYSVIVLLNVETKSLGPKRLEVIRKFVERGGGLVLFGRSYDFGPDGYAGTPLEEMMPVTFVDEHSFNRQDDGLVLKPDKSSSWKWNLSFEKSPRAYYVQNLVPKDKASVELRAGDQGILFSGSLGAGRVVACGLTIHGQAAEGNLAFWDWPDWPKVLGQSIDWAASNRPLHVAKRTEIARKPLDDDQLERVELGSELGSAPVSKTLLAQFVAAPTAPAAAVLLNRFFVDGQTKLVLSREAVAALAPFVQPDLAEPLLKNADALNPDIELRRAALELLGATHTPAARKKLLAALEDKEAILPAIDGLRRHGDPASIPTLKQIFQQREAQADYRQYGMVGVDILAGSRNGVIAVHSAAALYALGEPKSVARMAGIYREVRLLRRVFGNATKITTSHASEGALAFIRYMQGMRNNMASMEEYLLTAAGPVPESQRAAFVEYACQADDDSEIRWLSTALTRSSPDARWSGLSQAKDGILRRLGAALSETKSLETE